MAEDPKKKKADIKPTGIGWLDRARSNVQNRAKMGDTYRPESMWAGRLIPRRDGDVSMDVLRRSNPRLFNTQQQSGTSSPRVPSTTSNPSVAPTSASSPRSPRLTNTGSKTSGTSSAKPKADSRSLTEQMLSAFNDSLAYDRWANGPNDSKIGGVSASQIGRQVTATDPTRAGRMSGALASRMPQSTAQVPSGPAGTSGANNQSGVNLGSISDIVSNPNAQRIGANLVDAAASVFATMKAARTRVPEFEPSQGYRDVQSRLTAASNVGVTAAEQSAFQSNLDRTASMGLDSISRFAGAGGSAGAALGAIGRLGASQAGAQGQFAMQDQSIANQNIARLGSFEASNRQMDYGQIFAPQREQAISDRSQLAQAALLNRRQIADRNDYYNTFIDPNSPYQRMEEAKIATQQRIADSIGRLETADLNTGGTNSLYALSDTEMNDRITDGFLRNAGIGQRNTRRRNNSVFNFR